jgi:sugar O-acyltransferase (sialic acid O-acetyltransferase NeuD family)
VTRLAILGASGHGKVVADAALLAGWTEVVFYDDHWPALDRVGPWAVVGSSGDLLRSATSHDAIVVAIGDNRVRLAWQREIMHARATLASIVHPAAVVSPHACVGPGSVICAAAVVNPFAIAGAACIINTGATVDHDCVLADGVHVSPGAHLGGGVRIGEASWVGIGASVRHGSVIGANVMVGAGAAVVGDVGDGLTVIGVPARPLRQTRES